MLVKDQYRLTVTIKVKILELLTNHRHIMDVEADLPATFLFHCDTDTVSSDLQFAK